MPHAPRPVLVSETPRQTPPALLENLELRQKFLQDYYTSKDKKKVSVRLFKNLDMSRKERLAEAPDVRNSSDLRRYVNKDSSVKVPYKEIAVTNNFDFSVRLVKPPDLELE